MLQASRRILTTRAFISKHHSPPATSQRSFVLTASSLTALPLHPSSPSSSEHASVAHVGRATSDSDDYISQTLREKYNDLIDSLLRDDPNPNRIWAYYNDFLDFTRDGKLPLEVHQVVLRKCTADTQEIRSSYARRLRDRPSLESPHRREERFTTVISNMRRTGYAPTLEDYDFILSQFAAVGHYVGSVQLLKEIVKADLTPRTRTFGLCLQAIAYRLTLPCRAEQQTALREQCSQLCLHIVGIIRRRNKRVPSACLDLALRIMKDTDNTSTFASLLKIAYGIDLEYLDRHPIISDDIYEAPEPFSTEAFTTLVDFWGRQKQVSKMVAAFEVLSTPLTTDSTHSRPQNFDDEDDDDYFVPNNASTPRPLPSAQPNITTYNTLIRHCAHSRQTTLAKHYVLQALDMDYSASTRLQTDIQTLPLVEIRPPELKVNVDTFRPLLGLGNRNTDLALIKWMLPHFRMALRWKKRDFEYYSSILENPDAGIPSPTFVRSPGGLKSEDYLIAPASDVVVESSSSSPSSFFTSSSPPAPIHSTPALSSHDNPLDIDLESPPPAISRVKPFDIALYTRVLQRDIVAMSELDDRIGTAISRLSTRRKEYLGRRIWADKTIYVRDVNARVKFRREKWMDAVNFGGADSRQQSTSEGQEKPVESA